MFPKSDLLKRGSLSSGCFRGAGLFCIALLTTTLVAGSDPSTPTDHSDKKQVGTKKGQMYPDFLLPTIDGGKVRLSDLRGKKVLLFHFASW